MLFEKDKLMENVVYCAHRHVLVHVYLLNDGSALFRYLFFRKLGIEEDVADDVERGIKIAARDLGVVGGTLLGGEGVVDAPHAVELFTDSFGTRALRRSFEEHVLEEVREAILARVFVATARAAHHDDGGGLVLRHRHKDDTQAIMKRVDVVLHPAHRISSFTLSQ